MNAPKKVKQLSSLAAKPQLISIVLDDQAILDANDGYAIEFFTWDRQPIDTFAKLANVDETKTNEMIELACTVILDAEGNQIIKDGVTLKTPVLMAAMQKVVAALGN